MHLNAHRNQYADLIGKLLDWTPKAVLAAIAVSALTQGGDYLDEAAERVAQEWVILHQNGIVPQKPPASVRALAAQAERKAIDHA